MKLHVALSSICIFGSVAAQQRETVHAAVIFSRHGDRTPIVLQNSTLTPLGAQQMYSSGAAFRARYISPPGNSSDSAITALNPHQLDNIQLYAMGLIDDYVSASSQAFLQGLYPPTNQSTFVLNQANIVANGSVIQAPLGGYQYPQLQTVGPLDPNWIWLSGNDYCPSWTNAASDYFVSQDSINHQRENADFYARIRSVMYGSGLSTNAVGYTNAYMVYDYVNYQYTHNQSTKNSISVEDLQRLQMLASAQQWAQLGNLSASGVVQGDRILAVAGKTLATKIIDLLESNIDSAGVENKISPLFGYKNPIMSFMALAQLPSVDSNFYGLPDYGASMVFELYSLGNNTTTYPSRNNLRVRFLFRNGTDSTDGLIAYPLFGRPRSQTDMSWTDFRAGMSQISSGALPDWCKSCNSNYLLCPLFVPSSRRNRPINTVSPSGMKPAVAGVIGAIVTLAVVGIATALAMLLGGIRLRRESGKRRSNLSGFKGSEKLASDADLTSGKVADAETGKGHERVGSWEMKNSGTSGTAASGAHRGPSIDADLQHPESVHRSGGPLHEDHDDLRVNPFSDPVKPHEAF